MKTCTKCGVEKELAEFGKDNRLVSGRGAQCRECLQLKSRAYVAIHRERLNEQQKVYHAANREKHKARHRAYHSANREALNAVSRSYHAAHFEQDREKNNARGCAWARANPGIVTARANHRRAIKLQRTFGIDLRIEALYEVASWLRRRGDDVHVDHIVPLQPADPDSAVGLHTYANLRIIPAVENLQKGNR